MHYIVLGGGNSPEHDVSLRSANAVQEALTSLNHTVTRIDPSQVPIEEILSEAQSSDGVFPILHGVNGEDGAIQAELEAAQIPYFGPSAASCAATFDKTVFKKILEEKDLPTPRWSIATAASLASEPLTKAAFVLKPYDGGSSIDTFIVRTTPFDATPLLEALSRHGSMLIEELIVGHEITVGVLDDTALPVVEIIPPKNKEFDYENKYNGSTLELCPPQNISAAVQRAAQDLALQVHKATNCRHLSRTDIMIDSEDRLYAIDTNTIPGLTKQSLYPKAAAAAGYSWDELVRRFTELPL